MALRRLRRTSTSEVTFVDGPISQAGRATQKPLEILEHSIKLQQHPPKVTRDNLKSPSKVRKNRLKAAASEVVGNANQGTQQGKAAVTARGQVGEAAPGADGPGGEASEAARGLPTSPSGRASLVQGRGSMVGGGSMVGRASMVSRNSQVAQGELAQAIAERLRQRRASSVALPAGSNNAGPNSLTVVSGGHAEEEGTAKSPKRPPGQAKHSSFAARGMDDGPWSSKFTAAMSPGSLNRWNEQRPDPGWYKVHLSLVTSKSPSWDFRERPKTHRLDEVDSGVTGQLGHNLRRPHTAITLSAPETPVTRARSSSPCFMTAVDSEAVDGEQELLPPAVKRVSSAPASPARASSALRRSRRGSMMTGAEKLLESWARGSARPDLGRIGRTHIIFHEVSHPAEDLLDQDIKAYHNLRYPRWDFAKDQGRNASLERAQDANASCPGKYEPNYGAIKPRTTGFVEFGRALPRSVSATTLGYQAPEAVLHPEDKRFRGGCVMDRSRAKDSVRHRITHVNDYDRDMGRAPPPTYPEYHDKKDPAACESVLRHMMEFDADKADRYVTHRRDIGPSYATMIPRGRHAVQGNRALSHDLGVRGAVGLCFKETSVQRDRDSLQRECRKADGARERPDLGPKFDHYTTYQTTVVQNNFVHGSAPVQGSGPKYKPKPSPLRQVGLTPSERKVGLKSFERKADPGYVGRTSFGGTRVLQEERAHEALATLSGGISVN